jgi:hypothetical protein
MRPSSKGFARGLFAKDTWIGLLPALAALAVYLFTLSPSIGPEDTGELATVAATLGIAHPTGYPLFTLLGYVFAHLPLGDLRVIVKLNLMAAIFCSTAVFLFYRLFLVLLGEGVLSAKAGTDLRKGNGNGAASLRRFAAAAGALALAFGRIFWSNALVLEVYALHLLFLALTLLLFVLYLRAERDRDPDGNRLWLLFAYVFGLSFANHMMTVLLLPALLYLYFATRGFGKPAWVRIAQGIPAFLLGLTPYLYLPLRAATGPLMNWGNPVTWTNFRAHVAAEQYRDFMFQPGARALGQSWLFLAELPRNLGYGPLLLALAGWAWLWRRNRRVAVFSSLVFAAGVFHAVNYGFEDQNFRLNAHAMAAFWAACGAFALVRLAPAGSLVAKAMVAAVSLLALMPLAVHYRALDVSDHYAVEDYARNMLNSVEDRAVIVSGQEQAFTFPVYYLQLVEGVRPDVTVITRSMLPLPWYYAYLRQRDPDLIRAAQPEVDAFVSLGLDFSEDSVHARGSQGEARLGEVFQGLLRKGAAGRPLYVTADLLQEVSGVAENGITAVQASGLAYRLSYDTLRPPTRPRDFSYRPLCAACDTSLVGVIRLGYAFGYASQGVQAMEDGNMDMAERFFRSAFAADTTYFEALNLLRQVEQARAMRAAP